MRIRSRIRAPGGDPLPGRTGGALRHAPPVQGSAHEIVRTPFMPACLWPGTGQQNAYVPFLETVMVTADLCPGETIGPSRSTPCPWTAIPCFIPALDGLVMMIVIRPR